MGENYNEEKEIKKELVIKINQLIKIVREEEKIENETGLSFDELIESNEQYIKLSNKSSELHDEIASLLIDAKYFILSGFPLSDVLKIFDNNTEILNESNVEKCLDLKMLEIRDGMKRRLKQVRRICLSEHINPGIQFFYKEIIASFIYGNFNACCVLCRAITESMNTKFIEHQGHGDLLSKNNVRAKKMSIQDIDINLLGINKDLVALYTKIESKANEILHKQYKATEDVAFETIKRLQEFIEKFPSQK